MFKMKQTDSLVLSDEVDLHFRTTCPENRKLQKNFYRPAVVALHQWLGPLSNERFKNGGLTRLERQSMIAGEAALIIEASNFRAWSKSVALNWYQRAVFLRALVFGMTSFLSTEYVLHPVKNTRWPVFRENGADFFGDRMPVSRKSNILLPALNLEQALFFHLNPDFLKQTEDQMAAFATIASFSNEPDPENPITNSLRRAIRKVFRRTQEPIDSHTLRALLLFYPSLIDELGEGALLPPEDDEAIDEKQSPATDDGEAAASLGGPQAHPIPNLDKAERIGRVIASGLENGEIPASCHQAPFHAISGVPCLVWEAGIRNLASRLEVVTADELKEMFISRGWLLQQDGEVLTDIGWFVAEKEGGRRKKQATVQLAPLSESGVKHLIPAAGIPDNPALTLPDEGVT